MRDNDDWRTAGEYKESQLKKILKIYKPTTAIAIDDDFDGDTTHVYSKLGILHLKVMDRANTKLVFG